MTHSRLTMNLMLEWLHDCAADERIPPSFDEIAARFGLETVQSAKSLIADIAEAGAIRTRPAGADRFTFAFIGDGVIVDRKVQTSAGSRSLTSLPKTESPGVARLREIGARLQARRAAEAVDDEPVEQWPCGHDRTADNTIQHGGHNAPGCRRCESQTRAAKIDRRDEVIARTSIATEITAFLDAHRMVPAQFAFLAFGNGAMLSKFKQGGYRDPEMLAKARAFMAGYAAPKSPAPTVPDFTPHEAPDATPDDAPALPPVEPYTAPVAPSERQEVAKAPSPVIVAPAPSIRNTRARVEAAPVLGEVKAYCMRTGMSERMFGLAAVNDTKLVAERLTNDNILASTAAKIRGFMADHPDGVRKTDTKPRGRAVIDAGEFLASVAEYIARTGMSEAKIGRQATHDASAISRARSNGRVTAELRDRVLAWMADNPDGVGCIERNVYRGGPKAPASDATDLIADVDAYLARHQISESRFGTLAMDDGGFLKRVRDRGTVTQSANDRVRAFMDGRPDEAAPVKRPRLIQIAVDDNLYEWLASQAAEAGAGSMASFAASILGDYRDIKGGMAAMAKWRRAA